MIYPEGYVMAEPPITKSCLCILFWLPRLKSTSWGFLPLPTKPQANLVLSQIKPCILKLHSLETQKHEGMEVLRIFRNMNSLTHILLFSIILLPWAVVPTVPRKAQEGRRVFRTGPRQWSTLLGQPGLEPQGSHSRISLGGFLSKDTAFQLVQFWANPRFFYFYLFKLLSKNLFFKKCILSLCSPLSLKHGVSFLQGLWQLHHTLFSVKSLPKSLQLLWKLILFLEPLDV